MSLSTPIDSNLQFTKIFENAQSTKVFESLVNAGILPQKFQVVLGTVDLEGIAADDEAPILDAAGNQIFVSDGSHVVLASFVNTGDALTATTQVAIGLAATGGANQAIASSLIAAADAEVGQSTAPLYVLGNNYLTAGVTVATNTAASVLQVVLVLV